MLMFALHVASQAGPGRTCRVARLPSGLRCVRGIPPPAQPQCRRLAAGHRPVRPGGHAEDRRRCRMVHAQQHKARDRVPQRRQHPAT